MGQQSDLARRMEEGKERLDTPAAPAADRASTIAGLLRRMGPQIQQALPRHMTPDRLLRVAVTLIRTTPALMECSDVSLLAGIMQAAQLGLEPGMLGQCYLVPFRNNRTGTTEATFIIGYKGMIDLARRSGDVSMIYAKPVFAKDEFSYTYGLNPDLVHVPFAGEQPQDEAHLVAVYMVARFKDGGFHFGVMNKAQIEDIRKRSKAGDSGPWKTDYIPMALKSVIRQEWKWLPVSIEALRAVMADETAKDKIEPIMLDVVPTEVMDLMPADQVQAALAEAPAAEADAKPDEAAKPKGRKTKADKPAEAAQDAPGPAAEPEAAPQGVEAVCGKCGACTTLAPDTLPADAGNIPCPACGEQWLTLPTAEPQE